MSGPAISARPADCTGLVNNLVHATDRDRLLIANRNQFHGRSKNYSQYLQLAISIAVDLRLDRRGIRQKPDEGSKRDPIVRDGYKGEGNAESAAQRAAAGVFYIASTCVT
jgi:hypothetical protein